VDADVNEIQASDLGQADIEPAKSVAGSNYQAVGHARVRSLEGNVANYVKLVPAPFRIELAQCRFTDSPPQNVPGTDMAVHAFDFAPPILRRLAHIPHIFTHFCSQNIENPKFDSGTN
jgi:hypothetical protein